MIMMIVFWALITIAVVVAFAGWSVGKESQPYSALEFLRRRYARGEINKKEFESRKRDSSSRAVSCLSCWLLALAGALPSASDTAFILGGGCKDIAAKKA
jgi:putative membrane protein